MRGVQMFSGTSRRRDEEAPHSSVKVMTRTAARLHDDDLSTLCPLEFTWRLTAELQRHLPTFLPSYLPTSARRFSRAGHLSTTRERQMEEERSNIGLHHGVAVYCNRPGVLFEYFFKKHFYTIASLPQSKIIKASIPVGSVCHFSSFSSSAVPFTILLFKSDAMCFLLIFFSSLAPPFSAPPPHSTPL